MQRSDTVKEEGTAGGELDAKEVNDKGEKVYNAGRNISPLESEAVKPTNINVVPVVHSDIMCDRCEVCISLRSDSFRRWSDYYGLGTHRKNPLQARVGSVSSALTMTSAASAIRQLNTITVC